MLASVIFDFDGIVIDSETPEYESHRRIYERYGVTLTVDEWCGVIGTWSEGHDEKWFTRLCERAVAAPGRDAYFEERRRLFEEIVPADPMRGVRELLEALRDADVPAAIASSAPARWVAGALDRLGISSFFAAVVTGDQVTHRKPAPDVYVTAAHRIGADPRESVAIEDSSTGIAAARAAGMKVVAIPHWLTERHDLSGADLIVEHAGLLTLDRLERLVA